MHVSDGIRIDDGSVSQCGPRTEPHTIETGPTHSGLLKSRSKTFSLPSPFPSDGRRTPVWARRPYWRLGCSDLPLMEWPLAGGIRTCNLRSNCPIPYYLGRSKNPYCCHATPYSGPRLRNACISIGRQVCELRKTNLSWRSPSVSVSWRRFGRRLLPYTMRFQVRSGTRWMVETTVTEFAPPG
jgi:hypothetical protein